MIERARVVETGDKVTQNSEEIVQTERNLVDEDDEKAGKMERRKPMMSVEQVTDWVRVHKTENIYDSHEPWWQPLQIGLTTLCNNRKTLPLRISVMCFTNSGEHTMYGRVVTSIREIEMSDKCL
jgi:hypothetical protein